MKHIQKAMVALWALCASGIAQAAIYTLVTTGTISSGNDNLGLFGQQGASLVGQSVTLTQMFDSSSLAMATLDYQGTTYQASLSGQSNVAGNSLTIGGATFSAPATDMQTDLYLGNMYSQSLFPPNVIPFDQIGGATYLMNPAGLSFKWIADFFYEFGPPLVTSLDFSQTVGFSRANGYGYFTLDFWGRTSGGDVASDTLEAEWSSVILNPRQYSVSEPSSWTLALLGVLTMILASTNKRLWQAV